MKLNVAKKEDTKIVNDDLLDSYKKLNETIISKLNRIKERKSKKREDNVGSY